MENEQIDHEVFVKVLGRLDEKLVAGELELYLNIYGEKVMMACKDGHPGMIDMDELFQTSPQINRILTEVQKEFNLKKDWIHLQIREPLKHVTEESEIELFQFQNLTIITPTADQMLSMKILSARPEPYNDYEDVAYLIEFLRLESLAEVLETFNKFFGIHHLGQRQKDFLQEVGESLGYSWTEFVISK